MFVGSGPMVEATLGLDTTAFQRGLARANAAAAGFKGAVEKLGLSSLLGPLTQGAGAGIVVGALVLGLRAGADAAAKLREEAEATGRAMGDAESRAAGFSDRMSAAGATIQQMLISLSSGAESLFDRLLGAGSGSSTEEIAARLRTQAREMAQLAEMQQSQLRSVAETEALRERIASRAQQLALDALSDQERELELTRQLINLRSEANLIGGATVEARLRQAQIELEILETTAKLEATQKRMRDAEAMQLATVTALQLELDLARAEARQDEMTLLEKIEDAERNITNLVEYRSQIEGDSLSAQRERLETDLQILGVQQRLTDLREEQGRQINANRAEASRAMIEEGEARRRERDNAPRVVPRRDVSGEVMNWDDLPPWQQAATLRYSEDPARNARIRREREVGPTPAQAERFSEAAKAFEQSFDELGKSLARSREQLQQRGRILREGADAGFDPGALERGQQSRDLQPLTQTRAQQAADATAIADSGEKQVGLLEEIRDALKGANTAT